MERTIVYGKIWTGDDRCPLAEAMVISEGRVLALGTAKQIEAYKNHQTNEIHCGSGLIMPGITEGHAHVNQMVELLFGPFVDGKTVPAYQAQISDWIKKHPDAQYIYGCGFENGVFDADGPRASQLDEIEKDRPIVMASSDHHAYWVNTKAMEISGIDESTPNPLNGEIVKDADGKPTGWLKETASALAKPAMPEMNKAAYKKAIIAYQDMALSYGVTSVYEPMMAVEAKVDDIVQAYQELTEEGRLYLDFHVSQAIRETGDPDAVIQRSLQLREQFRDNPHVSFDTIKMFMDGVVEGHTAYLRDDYSDAPGDCGACVYPDQDVLNGIVKKVLAEHFHLHVHAIGDAALDAILTAVEKAEGTLPKPKGGFHVAVTHLQVVAPDQIEKMKRLGIVAVVNPYWHWKDPVYYDALEVPYLGEERAAAEYPVASFVKSGVTTSQGSDFPVTVPPDTMLCLHMMVNRLHPDFTDAGVLGPKECISVDDALKILTVGGAIQNDVDEMRGALSPGKRADFIALDQDVTTLEKRKLFQTKVKSVWIAGKQVYKRHQ
ncbi:amidohydrolase [Pseudoramibacter porci]|uniref:Amidohydrolase n=1 Tax=Pseudoramibacter porci TaxID=2606631 RepID=A0A7X2NET8_9FIRM|nr:amidohydrolase [Pseudoramibacter porci]MSS19307.1 amidohydrolase [Pseudoramibacter porci]